MVLRAPAPIETGPLRLETLPLPEPAADGVLVRVTACGLCRTDLHIVEGELAAARSPLIPGHQIVGRVEGLGAHADRFRVGERVGIAWLRQTCNQCDFCRSGRENLCAQTRFTGYHADGGYAEYAVVPEAFAYRLPSVWSDREAAPLLCAGIIGYRALNLAAVPSGGRLAMYGFGSSAHVTLQVARARGLEVYVATRGASHRELARALGAAWVGDAADAMPTPVDSAIIFAPAGGLVPPALRNLARGGTLVLAGVYMTPIPGLDYGALYYERVIKSVTANTRADGEGLLSEAAKIPIRPATTAFALSDANRGLELLKRGERAGSGVLVMNDESAV